MNIFDAFYNAVHSAVGGCEALAVRMGMSAAVLRNKANPHAVGNVVSLQDADRVMALTGDHGVLHALAANHGYVCVRVGEGVQSSDTAVLEIVTNIWASNGDLGKCVHEALADGRIDRHEVERIQTLVFDASRAMHELVARMDGMAQG